MKLDRQTLTNFHLAVASFFLPFALMFLVTGALYTVSVKGGVTKREERVSLAEPLQANLDSMTAVAAGALARLDIGQPSGQVSLRKAGTSFQLEWGGVARSVVLMPTSDPDVALLVIEEGNLHRRMVQLHKAKGSAIARGLSILWSVGLLAMFTTGLAMAWAVPKYRRLAMISGGAGLVVFACYFFLG